MNKSPSLEELKQAVLRKRLNERMRAQQPTAAKQTIPIADRNQPLPLSWAQQRLWFLDQLDSAAGAAYHLPAALRLRGRLDRQALQASLDRIVERHEVLRTTFIAIDGEPVQRIHAPQAFELPLIDLRARPDAERSAHELAMEEAHAPFDLSRGPLLRGRLLQLADDEHILLLTQHHIVSDGWSIGVLVRDLSALYGAFAQGLSDPLPPLSIQYADYAVWQRQALEPEMLRAQVAYWKQQLSGAPELLALPTDRPRPAVQSYAGGQVNRTLSPTLSATLRQLCQRHGVTLFMAGLAAWSVLLSRWCGQSDVVIGIPAANRPHDELESLIGFFVNTSALRIRLDDALTVEALLASIQQQLIEAHAYQDVPFEQVVEALQPARSLGHSPVFQVMLAMNNTPGGVLDLPGLNLQALEPVTRTTHFDLTLYLQDDGKQIECRLAYASDLFDRTTTERMARQFERVLHGMTADPTQTVDRLPLLDIAERRQVVETFNDTTVPYPSDGLIHQLFEQQALANPDAVALLHNGESLRYGELNRRANQLAHALIAQGVGPDDRVAIGMERCIALMVSLLGVLKAGAAYVPLDPAYPAERLVYMVHDSAPSALLAQSSLQARWISIGVPVLLLDDDGLSPELAAHSSHNPIIPALCSRNLAYVMYTSGSTGEPKGVMVEHRSVLRLVINNSFAPLTRQDVVVHAAKIAFDAATWEVWGGLLNGACVLLIDQADVLEPGRLLQALVAGRATAAFLTVSLFNQYSVVLAPILPQFRHLLIGGEAVDVRTVRRVLAATPPQRLVNGYGPTETTTFAVTHAIETVVEQAVAVPIGRPIANTRVYILDRHGEPVPVGVSGEIHIGGPGVARGYWNRPQLTAERFLPDPFVKDPQARMYKTGDLGRWLSNGTIEYLGRNDFQLKLRGFRIELGEIEAMLSKQTHVRDVVVIAREDKPGDKRLVAYLTMQDGQLLSATAMRDALAKELPEYMLPGAFVQLEQWPLTPNGKLDRKALPAPDQQAVATRAYEAPQSEVEQAIAAIWQELLSLERVGRHDHFFELGGHSLLAVQMIARLRKVLRVDVALRDLFVHAHLQALAQFAAQAARAELAEIRAADRSKPLPLSWPQQRLWFIDQFDSAASASYHVPAALRIRGRLNWAALSAALGRIVVRHEILRTVFVSSDGQPVQVIREADQFDLRVHDLRAHADIDAVISELRAEEACAPFDLSTGPLLRGTLLQCADDDHILLLTQHHIVSDGWSIHVLVREASALYTAYSQGRPDPLPALPIQYADYAVWQRDETQRAMLQTQAAYWKTQLDGAPILLSLPTDRPRPAVQSHAGEQLTWTFAADAEHALRMLSQQHDTTLFMTALAAWSIVLSRWSGQGEVVIGTPVANRQRSELEPLLGFFVNTLALRIRLDDAPTVETLLARIRSQSIEAYAHQDLPFEQLVEVLQPPRSLSHSPVFQVSLAFNNTPDGVLELPGLRVEVLEQEGATAHFDMTMSLHEAKGRLVGNLSYASDLFDRSTIERMARHFMHALRGMSADIYQPVDRLPLLDDQECLQLLAQLNAATTTPPTPSAPIHLLFEQQVQRTPDAIALSIEDQSLTYAQLNAQANRLAHVLIGRGIKPNNLVALGVERSLAMVIGILGILKAGAGYVPLDPSYPTDRLATLLSDSTPALLLTQASLQAAWPGHVPMLQLDNPSVLAAQPTHNPQIGDLTDRHLAYVIYTSGSTGAPKGVMVAHGSLSNYVWHVVREYLGAHIAGSVVSSPLSFDATVTTLLPPLLVGKPVLLLADDERCLPQLSARLFAAGMGWLFKITPAHLDALSYLPEAAAVNATAVVDEAAHCIVVGGEQLSLATLRRWKTKLLPAATFINEYGPTEATVGCSVWRLSDAAVLDTLDGVAAPIGHPIGHTRLYVLNEGMQLQPMGSVGELYIGGEGVTLGYLGRAALTAERFVRDPFAGSSEARLYRSGDLVRYRVDGELEFLGRRDGQIKLRGFRIELGEIEATLSACDGVRESLVIAREDVPGDRRLVAYITSYDGQPLSTATLRDALAKRLPEYMLPSAFVQLEQLLLTPNGKLDRQALPVPDQQAAVARAYEVPQGEVEQTIAAIWRELLGLERVGRQDQFFELGGHSLLAVQMVARLRHQGWPASVKMVFASPNLSALAVHITDDVSGADDEAPVPPNLIPAASTIIIPAMLPLVELTQDAIDRIIIATPGGVANIQDIYPLSPLQEGMLFHHLLETEGDAYLLQMILAFEQRDRLDAFLRAMQQVIERHDVLRSALHWQGLAQPVQVVHRHATLSVQELELQDAEEELLAYTDPRRIRLDLSCAPLLRAVIARSPRNEEWLLALVHHHVTIDHVTLEIMVQEIQAILEQQSQRLPRPVPYRNFIAQVQRIPASVHEAYFREQLGQVEEPTCLFDIMNVHADGRAIREERVTLGEALSLRVRDSARQLGVSAAVLFHVAWAHVLSCCAGQDKVVFGTVLAGRSQVADGADRMLGLFINTLPLRVALAHRSVRQVIEETYRDLIALLTHEQAPLALAQRCSGVAPNLPLFNTLLNYRHSHIEPPAEDGFWQGVRTVHAQERTNYPVTLSVDDLGERFDLVAQCASEIDPARLIRYMDTVMHGLVDALQAQGDRPMHTISMLSAAERNQVLETFNTTAAPYPDDSLVHQLFEQQVERSPNAMAVVFEDQALTYAQLNAHANRLAHYLIAQGTQPGDCIVTVLERSVALVTAQLAILKAGATYVPIDPQAPATRQAWMIADCAARQILTDATGIVPADIDIPVVVVESVAGDVAFIPNPNLVLSSEAAAYVMYTSGSTGTPKGVLVPHRAVNRLIINNGYARFEATDRMAWLGNPAFDISTLEVWAPLLHGACLVVVTYACVLQPSLFRTLLQEQHITVLHLTAGLFSQVADSLGEVLTQLRLLLVGGDAVDVATVARVLERYRPQHLLHCYGPTESTTFATTCEITEIDPSKHRLPIGRPIANTRIYLLDAYGQPVPIGVAGELYIGGAGVASGYLNRPALTAERFLADPFSAHADARMYRTGDLARYLPDGKLEFLGRNDHQLKIRGYRIEPGEIEARLVEHPAVREAVVIAREDRPGDKRLVAYVLAQDTVGEADALVVSLRAHVSAHLPEYMLPSAFVPLEQWPLTPNGKLDRRALPAPDQQSVVTRAYEAPQGEVEQAIAAIWQELLSLERVGRHDHFFELGGHSLLAVRMIARLRQQGLPASVKMVFASPGLSTLATDIAATASQADDEPPIPPNLILTHSTAITPAMLPLVELTQEAIDRIVASTPGGVANIQDIYPLSPLQEGMLFHHLLDTEGDAYLLRLVLAFEQREQLDTFLDVMQQVIKRHDVLRSAVHWQGLSRPIQVVHRHTQLPVEERLLLGVKDAETELLDDTDPRHVRLDLSCAPLLRAFIAKNPRNNEWLLALMHHHIVSDHVTLEIMVQEIQAILQQQSGRLPRPVPYRNFIAQALSISPSAHEAYFREHLGDVETPTCLFDVMNVHDDGRAVREGRIALDDDLGLRVRESARRHGVSTAVLFHVAWAQVLSRCTGQDDVVFGTVLAGRSQTAEGADRMLGLFINTLPLRVALADRSVRQVVEETYRHLSMLLTNEQAPLALAQRCSGVSAKLPLFNSLLNYRHSHVEPPVEDVSSQGMRIVHAQERTNYPVGLSVDDLGEGFELSAQCVDDIDPTRLIDYLCTVMHGLVDALQAQGERPMHAVSMLGAAERQRVLETFNATAAPYPDDRLIHQLFEAQVATRPDATALICEQESLSYDELNRRANQVAHWLRGFGVGTDDRVAICTERGLNTLVGMLGIMKAGAAYVPLDLTYPDERLTFMLQDSAPVVLLMQSSLTERLPPHGVPTVLLDQADVLAAMPVHNPDHAEIHPHHVAYVIYTSGSTGRPKGVMNHHAGLCNLISALIETYSITPASRVLQFTNCGFDPSILEMMLALCAGASLHIPRQGNLLVGAVLQELLADGGITHVNLPPVVLASLPVDKALGDLHTIIAGGDVLPPSVADAWANHYRLFNAYGPTEATICSTVHRCVAGDRKLPIGRPIANMRMYLLDRHGDAVPVGVTGEIHIAGVGVARGYLHRADLSTERFLRDPFVNDPSARMYKSGDLGRWLPNGEIEFLGRNDFQVKIRGFRIELGEIEAKLLQQANVRDAVVVVREDIPDDKRLVAYLTSHDGEPLSVTSLRDALAKELAEYMLPSAFVQLKQWPLTPNGKLDRRALPAPDQQAVVTRKYEAPQGDMEQAMAAIWQEVLSLERVGRHDNFFELGGHSLLAVRMIACLRERLGIDVPLRTLFSHSTLAGFACAIEQPGAEVPQDITAIRHQGSKRALFLVHPGGGEVAYAALLSPWVDADIPIYGLAAAGLLEGETPLETVHDMAARYVRAMRRIQPEGPYRMAGYSAGGVLAYEMAYQLVGADAEVEFVGLIDTNSDYRNTEVEEVMALDEMSMLLWLVRGTPDDVRLHAKHLADQGDYDALLRHVVQHVDYVPREMAPADVRRTLAVLQATSRAICRYLPSTLPVPVTMFSAKEEQHGDPTMGWGRWMPPERFHVVAVDGNHTSLMEEPHIRGLGAALSRALAASETRERRYAEMRYQPRIDIQTGKRGVTPLFCIPGAGAGVAVFHELSQTLPQDIPVYGLQPRGLDGEMVPYADVGCMARAYIQAIKSAQQTGPYQLLGHSFGGWVAFEIALQLAAAGDEVAGLYLLDSRAPREDWDRQVHRLHTLMKLIELYDLRLDTPLPLTEQHLRDLDAAEQIASLHQALVDAGVLHRKTPANVLYGVVRVMESNLATGYVPDVVYPGHVHLFSANDARREKQKRIESWRLHAPALHHHQLPGNHVSMLTGERVAVLGRWLGTHLIQPRRSVEDALAYTSDL